MGSIEKDTSTDFDVVIVGAGISGINAAYRVQSQLPEYSYTILENRGAVGGTWDLFRYPGIRSDSDLHTFGFPWRPWAEKKAIADGESIRNYIKESAAEYGIDKKIKFHQKLKSADWSSESQNWSLSVEVNGEATKYTAKFVILSTGYYDYNEPLKAEIPGLENFKGQIIHPQFWPEDLDYTGKKIVVIGSGATAITLLPNLVDKAARVTMLQRSPSYVMALPSVDPLGNLIKRLLPKWIAFKLVRWKFLVLPFLFFQFCRAFPNAGRKVIRANTLKQLPKNMAHDPNFNPRYNPWEQRLCICPDGDFFTALHKGNAEIVTDTIETVTATGITTVSGTTLDADIIVTATGLKMLLGGGARISVDGTPVPLSQKFMWKGALLQDLPNAAFVIGYTNASWTLGADATATLVCRLLKHMQKTGMAIATPRVRGKMSEEPVLNLSSTYIEKAKGAIPKAGGNAPWRARKSYFGDMWAAKYGPLTTDLEFVEKI